MLRPPAGPATPVAELLMSSEPARHPPTAATETTPRKVRRLNTPVDTQPGGAPEREYSDGLDSRTRRGLWITIVTGVIVAATHQSLTAAVASVHRDTALRAADAVMTWPLPMIQPIVAGIAAFVLLGFAVQTTGWRFVSARQARLVIGFAIAACLAAGPMVLFVALTILACAVVIAIALTILFMILLLFMAR